nr:TBC1 domain family member 31-like [Biomphalaria glabrata]
MSTNTYKDNHILYRKCLHGVDCTHNFLYSGFLAHRVNLSPFTKDFRAKEQFNESKIKFFKPYFVGQAKASFSYWDDDHLTNQMEGEISDKCRGKIWHRKPSPSKDDGIIIKLRRCASAPFSVPSRQVPFLRVAFDNKSDRFIAGDSLGNIYLFDLTKNRYTHVQKTGQPCTALAFGLHRKAECLVALGDNSLTCYDTEKKEVVAIMKDGHESVIHGISVHMNGHYAITTSTETTLLWDLNTFQKKHKLNIKEEVDLAQSFFLPNSNTIMTCFKDDTIFAWDMNTLTCKFQLPVPIGENPKYRAFATTKDSRYLIAGGKSRFLHLWSLDSRRVIRVIEMPNKVTSVKQLEFLQDNYQNGINQILGVLSQDGIMRFINIDSCKLLFDIGTLDCRIRYAAVSPGSRHIVAVMENGSLNIYSVDALAADLNRPPPSLMKVVTSSNLSDTLSTENSMRRSRSAREANRVMGKKNGYSSQKSDKEEKDSKNEMGILNKTKLLSILKGYGEYPAKYRMFIWNKILELPENYSAYAALIDKGVHPAYSKLHEVYPIKSRKLLRILQRVLSALAHWSPIFGETQYLPCFVFPFVKLFQNNHLVCFELIVTIIVNWCQHWFEYFPNPPINVLSMIENLLAQHDPNLLQHFVSCGVTSQIYAWPLLETVFSEVLTQEEWLILWDNIISNHPAYMLVAVVAYAISARGPLMKCTEMEDFKFFFHHRNAISIKQIIKEANRLMESTPDEVHPQNILEDFVPLTNGNYPVFNKYPKFIVDYQVQERERIRQEEMEYMRQKVLTLDVQKETLQKQQEEQQWYRQQQLLLEAEERRRKMIQEEEAKLADQRKRLLAMNREVKLKELTLLEAARRKFLQFQKEQREMELRRLDDELVRKALQRDQETDVAIQEAEIKNMELQLQKKLFEQELYREFALQSQTLRTEQDLYRKQTELEDKMKAKVDDAERSRELEARKKMEQKLAFAAQQNIDMWAFKELNHKQKMAEMDKETDVEQLNKLSARNREMENEVYDLMNLLHKQKRTETAMGYEEIAEDRINEVKSKEHRMHVTEQDILAGRLHSLGLLDKAVAQNDTVRRPEGVMPPDTSLEISQLTFDRKRQAFDENEITLLNNVRQLRQKLATESRTKRPPPLPAD